MYTLQGKTQPTRHTLLILDPRRVPDHTSHVVHTGNLSLVPTRSKQAPTLRRSLDNQRQTDPTVVLDHLISPPSQQPWSRGEMFCPSSYTATSAYWAYITTYDRYVQCLLTGVNLSVLNRHRRGYKLGGASFPHTIP
jgi:hypothetical protein